MFAVKCALLLCVAASGFTFELGALDVVSHLYTRANELVSQPLLPSANSIMVSNFGISRNTIFTIHSNGEGVGGNFNAFVVPAHLKAEDVNVIAVDWSPGSGMYSQGLGNAVQCGEVIAQFVNILINQFSYSASRIRIVGIGLGAHIAGIAARKINGDVPHIIALDPSFYGWTHHPHILSKDAATVVEVLHTTAGHTGYDYPLGDIDFYANGGSSQNGCGANSTCSHTFAYVFYAESIDQAVNGGNQFVGTKCESYEEAIDLQCSGARDAIFGGVAVKESGSGIYTFLTNFVRPFARG